MTSRRQAWFDVGLWVLVQLTITSVPGSSVPVDVHHPWDWFVHMGMYGMLGLLLARVGEISGWRRRHLAVVMLVVSVAAALDEVHQLYIPGRNGSAMDWLFDTVGVGSGLLVGSLLMRSKVASWLR
jgi:VanZ family protein